MFIYIWDWDWDWSILRENYSRLKIYTIIKYSPMVIDFKQFDWFDGHRLSAHILVIDYIWKKPGNSIYFQINICR